MSSAVFQVGRFFISAIASLTPSSSAVRPFGPRKENPILNVVRGNGQERKAVERRHPSVKV